MDSPKNEARAVKIDELTIHDIASICDHTYLMVPESFAMQAENPIARRRQEFDDFLQDSASGFGIGAVPYAICVRHGDCSYAYDFLKRQAPGVAIASVAGFPDGNWNSKAVKALEAEIAMSFGAAEIDMVLNYGMFRKGDTSFIEDEIAAVRSRVKERNRLLKLILEASELSEYEVAGLSELANGWGVDFIKTSTGFASKGAEEGKLRIMRQHFHGGVKLSGGIKPQNIHSLLYAASGRDDGYVELDPMKIRVGESKLLPMLAEQARQK